MNSENYDIESLSSDEIGQFQCPKYFDELMKKGEYQKLANALIVSQQCYLFNGIKKEFKIFVGQSCVLFDQQSQKSFYVELQNLLITKFQDEEFHLFAQARLYYTKENLQKLHYEVMKECSQQDLFLTNISMWFYTPKFQRIIFVKRIEEYIQGNYICEDNCYWVRSEYDVINSTFTPDPKSWQRECICHKLCNPTLYLLDVQYCRYCNILFHKDCINYDSQNKGKQFIVCLECSISFLTKNQNSLI